MGRLSPARGARLRTPGAPLEWAAFAAPVGAAVSTVIYGVAMVLIGQRVPAKWWGEAVVVAVFYALIVGMGVYKEIKVENL